ncbi:TetR/AcrR family transcriptional regulator [Spirochaeta isovalerica]|uniref:AcrR family transcriptional regulator n=1 Tax=Spirochaeta isovalerica TaxID=150 RepID=A0A841R963_9SPIO|nr:hypothetical protein [Spirochaeta isovalerica]MBB6479727.1 AcrR family transcriptional regulator [Spirochaeta isovalerica]
MPRNSAINREAVLQAAFGLVRREGIHMLSARNTAAELNCSTQPLYNYFSNIADLEQEIIKRSYSLMSDQYMSASAEDDPFLAMGLGYLDFAVREPQLFYLLYLSGRNKPDFSSENQSDEEEQLLDMMSAGEGMGDFSRGALKNIHSNISIYTHGLALILYHDPDAFTREELTGKLTSAAVSFTMYEKTKEMPR